MKAGNEVRPDQGQGSHTEAEARQISGVATGGHKWAGAHPTLRYTIGQVPTQPEIEGRPRPRQGRRRLRPENRNNRKTKSRPYKM